MRAELYLLGLAPKLLRRLLKAQIFSLADLLICPNLSQILALPEDETTNLRARARSLQDNPTHLVHYGDERVGTGLRELDMLLDGGFLPGGIYEIVGTAGIEASRIACRVGVRLMEKNKKVLFCDIEGNFSRDLVPASLSPHFLYSRISTHSQLSHFLTSFDTFLPTPPFLCIFDGLSTLLRCLPFTDYSYDRVHKVIDISLRIQELGNRTGTVMLITNRYTMTAGGEMLPLLGESWSQTLVARIEVEKGQEGVVMRVRKSAGWDIPGEVVAYSI